MNSETARVLLTTQIEAALAAYPGTKPRLQYENRNLVDTSTQVDPFVGIDIVYINGTQLDLGAKPMSVQYGQIVITAFCKENSGTKAANVLLDYFLPWLELKEFSGVRTHSGMYSKGNSQKGWQAYPLIVPFWWTRVAA